MPLPTKRPIASCSLYPLIDDRLRQTWVAAGRRGLIAVHESEAWTVVNGWLQAMAGIDAETAQRLTSSLLFVGSLVAVRWLLLWALRRRGTAPTTRYRLRRGSAYFVGTVCLIALGVIWLRGLQAVATFAGLASAGIAIALKDIATNLAGWAFILWRRPFELGDRIEIGGLRGDVVDLGLFQHSVMEIGNWIGGDDRTGRIIHVPNAKVFTDPVANYTKGWFEQIWDEMPIVVTFESNWEEARRILERIVSADSGDGGDVAKDAQAPRATAYFLVLDASLKPAVYVSVVDMGVQLTLRYICHPRERRNAAQRIWIDVLNAFAQRDDIDFAYPTQRFYDNAGEGKKLLRPPAPSGG